MRWSNIVSKAKDALLTEPLPPATAQEGQGFKILFKEDSPIPEEAKKEGIKLLRQRGFQIASLNEFIANGLLYAEIHSLERSASVTTEDWLAYYNGILARLSEKRSALEAEIKEVHDRAQGYEDRIKENEARKAQIKKDIEALKDQLMKIRNEIAEAKKTIGGRLVADAETELERVIQLQKKVYAEVHGINEARFKNAKPATDELVRKWKDLRVVYDQRFRTLMEKLKVLNEYGLSSGTAYTLIALGSAMAGVAGYFFAIFSSSTGYSSTDVFYYLLKNIIDVTAHQDISIYRKFAYLLGALLIVTGISWSADRLILRANYFRKEEDKNLRPYSFNTAFTLNDMSYSHAAKEKSWLLLWLKVAPFLFVMGAILLLVSNGADIKEQTTKLSNATEGLLIGSAIAMGFAACVYLYIIKVIEPRAFATDFRGHIKRNSELAAVLVAFIISIGIFAFYRKYSYAATYSIVGFVGSCLITAFAFSYGLRFLGLMTLAEEAETQLTRIDNSIAFYSAPDQPDLDLNLGKYFNELGDGLLNHLKKKNEAILHSDELQHVKVAADHPEDSTKKIWKDLFIWKEKEKDLEDSNLFEIMEWEQRYFPELADQLKTLAGCYKDKLRELAEAETELRSSIADKETKKALNLKAIRELQEEVDEIVILGAQVEESCLNKKAGLEKELSHQIIYLRDGFELGQLYVQNNMGPRRQQLLLDEKSGIHAK